MKSVIYLSFLFLIFVSCNSSTNKSAKEELDTAFLTAKILTDGI